MISHGLPRLSADVDVTLEMSPDDPARFAREMNEAGFDLLVSDPDFLRRTHVLPFVHRATGMPVDVVLAGRPKDREDVRGLLGIHGPDVDLERICRVLRLLEEALSQSDLLPALESILDASKD